MSPEDLERKYPQVIPGTFRWNAKVGKQEVDIKCRERGCKNIRPVFVSDLFQVSKCMAHLRADRIKKRAEREAKLQTQINKMRAAQDEIDREKRGPEGLDAPEARGSLDAPFESKNRK